MNAGLEGILWKMLSVMSGGLCIKDCTRRSEPILSADVTPQYAGALLAGLEAPQSYSPTEDAAWICESLQDGDTFPRVFGEKKLHCTCDFIMYGL